MAKILAFNQEFNNTKDLVAYCNAQYLTLQAANDKIKKLEEEITHLQLVLVNSSDLVENKVERIIKLPELAICEAQIEILLNRALQKELTLEEIKSLDLLVKNKRLLTGESTSIEGQKKKPKFEFSDVELIKIAKIETKKDE